MSEGAQTTLGSPRTFFFFFHIDVHTFQYTSLSFVTLLVFWFGVQRVVFTHIISAESVDSIETQMAQDAEGDDYFVKIQSKCMYGTGYTWRHSS